jgi:hypothetical protein
MYLFKEMLGYLRKGFASGWAFVTVVIILSILDPCTFLGIGWFFLFRDTLKIDPAMLVRLAEVYLVLASVLGLISTVFGKLGAIRAVSLFYISVGLFFLLKGVLEMSGRDFQTWPWVLVWIATLGTTISQFGREYEFGHEKPPRT